MRGNNMGYFFGLIKKEFIEIRYSWKNLLFYGGMFPIFIYLVNYEGNPIIYYNNFYYILAIFFSSFMPSNFLMESILSDKRNQTFERYFVSGNIKKIMLAKPSSMSIFGIVPFIMFYVYLLINGINIIDTVYVAINTPFYFWIALCMITAVTFPFSNETSVAFAGLPYLLVMLGIIIANDYLAVKYHHVFTCIITIVCAVIVIIIAYKIYKNTKYFLKI
jgi:ABC-type Na+ efflux pump permease subunit